MSPLLDRPQQGVPYTLTLSSYVTGIKRKLYIMDDMPVCVALGMHIGTPEQYNTYTFHRTTQVLPVTVYIIGLTRAAAAKMRHNRRTWEDRGSKGGVGAEYGRHTRRAGWSIRLERGRRPGR